jgi:hypothetical protein
MEGDFPIILEVIDSEDINYTIERQKFYSKTYEEVHLFLGVDFIKN